MHGWAIFIIVIIVLGLIGGGGYFAYVKFIKARQSTSAGSGFPAPAPSGAIDWIKDKFNSIRNPKTQTGAGYESATGGYRARGAHGGALDPDEAWDSRVGNEADVYGPGGYYEEQELGLHQPTAYTGGAGFEQTGLSAPDATSRSKSPAGRDPFGDDNAESLRSVSPRPVVGVDTNKAATGAKKGHGSADSSPTFERRSIFREEV